MDWNLLSVSLFILALLSIPSYPSLVSPCLTSGPYWSFHDTPTVTFQFNLLQPAHCKTTYPTRPSLSCFSPEDMLANTTLVMHEITSSSIGRFIAVANPINAVIRLFTHPKLQDYFGILVLGIMAEITRRLLVINMPWLESLVTVKAIHTTLDDSHNWIMAFWMSHPDWQAKTRHFSTEVSFISAHVRSMPCKHRSSLSFTGSMLC